jgi:hypothetical protein
MAKQHINVGSATLAGDGEQIRSAFIKINSNFNELYETYVSIEVLKNLVETSIDFDDFKQKILDL